MPLLDLTSLCGLWTSVYALLFVIILRAIDNIHIENTRLVHIRELDGTECISFESVRFGAPGGDAVMAVRTVTTVGRLVQNVELEAEGSSASSRGRDRSISGAHGTGRQVVMDGSEGSTRSGSSVTESMSAASTSMSGETLVGSDAGTSMSGETLVGSADSDWDMLE